MRAIAARIHNGLSWLMFIGANLAIIAISLPIFGAGPVDFHRGAGVLTGLLSLLVLIVSLLARSSRLNVGVSFLVFALFFLQPILAYTDFAVPALHALHAVNALAILYLSYTLANGRARAVYPTPTAAPAAPAAAAD